MKDIKVKIVEFQCIELIVGTDTNDGKVMMMQ